MTLGTALERLEKRRARLVPQLARLAAPVLAVALTAFVLSGMLRRLALSVDFTDEAFSTALAYRFALGARPFVDEINSAQTAGMIAAPFIWLYLKITHSSAGIMSFTRHLFLVFNLAIGATVFRTIKQHVSWPVALVTSLVCVVLVPYSVPNLGYNVLGSGFLTIGGFVAVRGMTDVKERRAFFLAGLFNGLATLAYPPLAAIAVLLGLIVLVRSEAKLRSSAEYVGGGAIVVACVIPFLVAAGRENLQASIELGTRLTPRPASKLFDILLAFWAHSPVSLWAVPSVVLAIAALKIRPAWGVWILPLFVGVLALGIPNGLSSQLSIEIYAGLLAPAFLVLLWDDPFCRAAFSAVWVPSLFAGFITAYTSSNGELNGGLGFLPAAILFVVYEAIAVERLSRAARPDGSLDPARAPLLLLGPAILVLSLLARFSSTVYRDAAPAELTVRVESGPFRGLYTTPEHARFSADLEDALRRHETPDGKLLAYWDLPAAYLFTKMRPASNSVWISQMADPDAALASYRSHADGSGFALKVKASGPSVTPLDQFVEAGGRPLESTPRFLITAEPPR
jgi:hypothetical protein